MKKRLLISFSLLFFCFYSFAKPKKVDNTFKTLIRNNSDFSILIDEATIPSKDISEHVFPLHESDLYDSWNVSYIVPLSDSVNYKINGKIFIQDNQEAVIIENPKDVSLSDSYIVIQNDNNEAYQLTDSKKSKIYPCYNSGTVNERGIPVLYNIAPHSCVVSPLDNINYSLADNTNLSKAKLINLNIPNKKGYVYYVNINSDKVTLLDYRPMQSIYEKLWQRNYSKETVRAVLEKNESTFILGTTTVQDKNKNLYNTGFLQNLNNEGMENWKIEYAVPGADTFLYDMTFSSSDSIFVVGQSIVSQMKGLVLQYSLAGNLLQNITIPEVIGFELITPLSDNTFLLRGYDVSGNLVFYNLDLNGNYASVNNKFKSEKISALIQSESKYIEDSNRGFYIAGETSYLERPSATVIYLSEDGIAKTIYTAKEPFSFASDIVLDEENKRLVLVGSMNAKDSFGNGGIPFIRCIDLQTKEIIWDKIYAAYDYEACVKISALDSYGYIQLFVNADEEGNVMLPCQILRTDSTGNYN